jgi:hypothetical protein
MIMGSFDRMCRRLATIMKRACQAGRISVKAVE